MYKYGQEEMASQKYSPLLLTNMEVNNCHYKLTQTNIGEFDKTKNGPLKAPQSQLVCVQRDNMLFPAGPGGMAGHGSYVIIPVDRLRVDTDSQIGVAEDYRCWPPPWFVVTISALQLLLFIHYTFVESHFSHKAILQSVFLWKPAATLHVWRYIIYSLYHIGWVHLCFNLAVQLCIGVTLEMIHGAVRVALIYLSGVFLGSLSTILVDKDVVLVGSSGGVYALLAAHFADVLLNYTQMELGRLKLLAVITIAVLDIALAWLDQSSSIQTENGSCAVSYIAHITGATIGLVMGLAVLKIFTNSSTAIIIQKTCRIVLLFFTFISICLLLFSTTKEIK